MWSKLTLALGSISAAQSRQEQELLVQIEQEVDLSSVVQAVNQVAEGAVEEAAIELLGGGSLAIEGSTSYYRDKCSTDPKDNGCLCYLRDSSYAWLIPTTECGICPSGSEPVETDYLTVY